MFSALNFFQTWQSNEGIIWSERGNRAFYWATFGKTSPSIETFRSYDTNERQPPRESLSSRGVILSDSFEAAPEDERSKEYVTDGEFALLSQRDFSNWKRDVALEDVQGGDWLEISVDGYFTDEQKKWNRDHCTQFVMELKDADGKGKRWRSMNVACHIGNQDGSIWHTGTPGMWDRASFFMHVPANAKPDWRLSFFVWNTSGQMIHLDNLRVEHFVKD